MSKSKLLLIAVVGGLFASSIAVGGPVGPIHHGDCIDVIVWAINPATGECREFPTPCSVPAGWVTYNHDVCNLD